MKKQKMPSGLRSDIPHLNYEKLGNVSPEGSGSGCGKIILIVFGILVVLVLIAISVPPSHVRRGFKIRAKIARVQADLRTIATALETYYVDKKAFPSMIEVDAIPVSELISYVPSYHDEFDAKDPFEKDSKQTYRYLHYKSHELYILLSNGPDEDRDISLRSIRENVDIENKDELVSFLETLTYDPTNGNTSDGDIVRTNHYIP